MRIGLIRQGKRMAGGAERGSSLVEFALLAPLLVMLLVGILEFGRVLDAWLIVSNAAREGARVAALGSSSTQVQQAAHSYLTSGVGTRTDVQLPNQADIVVTNAAGLPGEAVTVQVPLQIWVYTPMIQSLLPDNPVRLVSAVTMRRQ